MDLLLTASDTCYILHFSFLLSRVMEAEVARWDEVLRFILI